MKCFNRGEIVYIPIYGHIARVVKRHTGVDGFYYDLRILNTDSYNYAWFIKDSIIEKIPNVLYVEYEYMRGVIL